MGLQQTYPTVACLLALVLCLSYGVGASYYLCPLVDETIIEESPCPTECNEANQCNSELNNTLCCPTSNCGQQCVRGVSVPYHLAPPPTCPELESDMVGTCTEYCSSDSDCSEPNKLCCSNGCGHSCTSVTPACRRILDNRNGSFLIGEYQPQCDDDGKFTDIQCHGSTGLCWCVRAETGEPVSTPIRGQPQCNTCSHDGHTYYPGDTFPNDCNICTCGKDGTHFCTEIACGPAPLFFSCPVPDEDMVGTCSEDCSGDETCPGSQKCCSNGCGHTCQDPTPIPFVPPPRHCPEDPSNVECNNGSVCSGSCDSHRQLCCQNSCGGQVCIDGELPVSPCTDAVNNLSNTLLGSYVPQCQEETGTFKTLQYRSHYYWCVDHLSGEPTSDMVDSFDLDSLECTKCSVDGREYVHDETMASHNGCAFKVCRAGEVVINDECKVCEYEGKVYGDGEVVVSYGGCSKLKCLSGELSRVDQCDSCVVGGHTYQHRENTDECGYCTCLDGAVACVALSSSSSDSKCGGSPYTSGEEGDEWWHYVIVGCGLLIALLVIIALILIVVMVVVVRRGQFHHTKLRDNSETLSFESETQIMFKHSLPEGESVELKVPVEDDEFDDPIKT